MEYIHVLTKRGKVIGVKNKKLNMKLIVGASIIYYFLYFALVINLMLITYLLFSQKFLYTVYATAFLILLIITITQEKRSLFLNISYPANGVIRINDYDLNYKHRSIRIFLEGIQSSMTIKRYSYLLCILEEEEIIYSLKIDYSSKKKIDKFIENLLYDDSMF